MADKRLSTNVFCAFCRYSASDVKELERHMTNECRGVPMHGSIAELIALVERAVEELSSRKGLDRQPETNLSVKPPDVFSEEDKIRSRGMGVKL